jgi:hypothetical protein
MKHRCNTPAFTFLAWASFVLAFLAMFIGIYTLDASLPVKGYYVVSALFLTMSSFVLQKTIRDNQEDDKNAGVGYTGNQRTNVKETSSQIFRKDRSHSKCNNLYGSFQAVDKVPVGTGSAVFFVNI